MPDDCQTIQPLLAGYALGGLEAEEGQQVEAHLDGCPACRALLREYQAVAEALLLAVPPAPPPAGMRSRLADLIGAEAAHPVKRGPDRRAGARWWALGVGLAGLLVVNLIGLVQLSGVRQDQSRLQEALGQSQVAQAIAAYPGAQSVLIEGDSAYGTMVFDPERSVAAVYTWGLAPLPADQTYQIWLRTAEGERTGGGTFQSGAEKSFTLVVIRAPQTMQAYSGVGVTIEPAGGSRAPTGASVLGGDF